MKRIKMMKEKMKKMPRKIQGEYCIPRDEEYNKDGCDYAEFSKDTHGACCTFTKLWCSNYKRDVDKGAMCLELNGLIKKI